MTTTLPDLMQAALDRGLSAQLGEKEAVALGEIIDLPHLMEAASAKCEAVHGRNVSYSRKVFIPLTHLCRDTCRYCTFAKTPRQVSSLYMSTDDVLRVVEAGQEAGCREALFTLGDRPEDRYEIAREALRELGHGSTLSYVAEVARSVLNTTSLLPHINPGVMTEADLLGFREVSVSQGMMLESTSARLMERGGPHHGCPDKEPALRLETLEAAGRAAVPFTTGILIGIGETRSERLDALFRIRESHERHGHVQEVIVQNFVAKPDTRMAKVSDAALDELLWTIAMARLILPAEMNIQAPPNLSPGFARRLIAAGINDLGGISPVTIDHVNPEKPWPDLERLGDELAAAGHNLVERLPVYPAHALEADRWMPPALATRVRLMIDGEGLARTDGWAAGRGDRIPATGPAEAAPPLHRRSGSDRVIGRAMRGASLSHQEVETLFRARGAQMAEVIAAADELRQRSCGDEVSYVVTRNINYTNICSFGCKFCAFAKGKTSEQLRGKPYLLSLDEIGRRAAEAWERGGVEVCLQGGIHPSFTGETYLDILRTVRAAAPGVHVHAFSPLEVWQGAQTSGRSLQGFLTELRDAGLGSLPGTAAEILSDDVRQIICPDKLDTATWLEVIRTAHRVGLRTTSTIMFGHADRPVHWARHLLHLRELQEETGGFTEFVPLPYVHMESPMYLKKSARPGPTYRESVLMHAVSRLTLDPAIRNIQVSWVKMGPDGAAACLAAGANDMGGTLMNESITRAAGATFGQEFSPAQMEALIRQSGRIPHQRSTLYCPVDPSRTAASFAAKPVLVPLNA